MPSISLLSVSLLMINPTPNTPHLKLNVDGAFNPKKHTGSIGGAIKDSNGNFERWVSTKRSTLCLWRSWLFKKVLNLLINIISNPFSLKPTPLRWETTLRILTLFKPHLTQIYKNCCCVHVGQGIGEVFEEFDQYSFH
ncbi:uncharacterized protein LOC107009545 isoform X1 [Solanum pennellii]|uniref:Uncharacterized protein LOC107009545 isoform X1 n=1 Tax=Solanum pennellii TaxID=28526 RepID=A0ABM1G0Y4_SOLPN|nr:uncharacterized protein LOC107009545 isoform X1 [Solanum pennellii]